MPSAVEPSRPAILIRFSESQLKAIAKAANTERLPRERMLRRFIMAGVEAANELPFDPDPPKKPAGKKKRNA